MKYRDVYESILFDINNDKYTIDSKLPSGDELARNYGCSKLTVKKALDILVQDGYIVRRRGSGSFVKKTIINPSNTHHLTGFSESHKHLKIFTNVIEFEIIRSTPFIASKLNLNENDFVYKILRVRGANNIPEVLEETYMPILIIPGLTLEHVSNSIYSYMKNQLNLKPQSAHVLVTVDYPTERDRTYLYFDEKEVVASLEQVAYLNDGNIFEYSISRHRSSKFKFDTVFVKSN